MGHRLSAWLCVSLWLWVVAACLPPPNRTARPTTQPVEQVMLEATVQLAVETWLVNEGEHGYTILKSEGHGTVVNGRFLITHNHHTIPLSLSETGLDPDIYTRLFISNSAGDLINVLPLTDFQIALREPQMLLLAYAGHKSELPFGTAGLNVEQIGTATGLEPGVELAQIDWDGGRTYVVWTRVTAVHQQNNPPCLELNNGTQLGASGGGIFWQGQHIGNSWLKGSRTGTANGATCQYSKAALNSPELLAYLAAHVPP